MEETMIVEGAVAPDFSLPDADGRVWSLADFRGKKLVLYFYPKDDTPGCTKEACGFRDAYSGFAEKNAVVVGVSRDSGSSHKKFAGKYSLPFLLLSDPDKTALTAYCAWGEKTMYGKKVWGIIRSTFVIDAEGRVAKVFPKVSPVGHAEEILAAL
jgi:peroxiredoxin Q/BCP